MLYRILKIIATPALYIFCRKIIINNRALLTSDGPLLLACNHPNSFLDAIILDVLFDKPIYSLARGDAFKNKRIANILRLLKILPVYRTSEGPENLSHNYKTFDTCINIFKKNGVVLIFSEGLCVNEWHLRTLKKGTARLAAKCREAGIPLQILPVGINYSSFRLFGKNVIINFGKIFGADEFAKSLSDGAFNAAFNNRLCNELTPLVSEIEKDDYLKRKSVFYIHLPLIKKILLSIPAIAGYIIHCPLYVPIKKISAKKLKGTVHYDSAVTGLLFISYLFYLLTFTVILYSLTKNYLVFILFIILPFTAWAFVQLKKQID